MPERYERPKLTVHATREEQLEWLVMRILLATEVGGVSSIGQPRITVTEWMEDAYQILDIDPNEDMGPVDA